VIATLRPGRPLDLTPVLALWGASEAEPTHTDDIDSLQRLIRRDPGALLVAEVDGELVGTVIAAWDGWRGSVYRLVVSPAHRRRGLARKLLAAAEERLASVGAVRLQAVVVETDARAVGFWWTSGWERQSARLRFVRG
jgi:ribosomal protein S18 acetylase RimI-like enzyme